MDRSAAAVGTIPPPPIQAFTRFINMVPLSVEGDDIYEVFPPEGFEKPTDYHIEHGKKFYVLDPPGKDAEPVAPVDSLRRRLIEDGFRAALSRSGCAFKDGQ